MPQLQEELTTDLSGGMFDSVASTRYPRNAAASILNGRMQPDGTVQRRQGSIKTHATLYNADIGYGGVYFRTAAGVDQIVKFVGTKAYRSTDLGATFTEIGTGLRADYYDFAIMRIGATTYLYAANGDTTVKRWDGTTFDTLASLPSGVKYVRTYEGRLWFTGHSGVLVQATKIGNPSVIASPDGLTIQVERPPNGLGVVGAHLFCLSDDQVARINGYGEQTLIVATGSDGVSQSVGCVAFRTIVNIGDNGLCWLSKRGIEYYTPATGIRLISKPIQVFLSGVDFEELYANPGRPSAVWDAIEQDYVLALSTTGARNNRNAVLNLRQSDVDFQRSGPRAAATIDQPVSEAAGAIFFGSDADGYLASGASGLGMIADADGYASLATGSDPGEPVGEDADGYLESITNDTLPASLFIGPSTQRASAIYSVGYDGYVRRHYGVDKDDVASDGSGGTPVSMTIRSRPFVFRRPRHKKRYRLMHVASLQESAATLSLLVRGPKSATTARTVTVPAVGQNQAHRPAPVKTKMDADAAQLEVSTTDRVRIALLGLSAHLLREPA